MRYLQRASFAEHGNEFPPRPMDPSFYRSQGTPQDGTNLRVTELLFMKQQKCLAVFIAQATKGLLNFFGQMIGWF
jgi:hypothetical protein